MSITFQSNFAKPGATASLWSRVRASAAGLAERRRLAREHKRLERLSDHLLRDIGLRREYGPNGRDDVRITRI